MSRNWKSGSTPKWRRVRLYVLQRDKYRCQINIPGEWTTTNGTVARCLEVATEVHHTFGRAVTGDDPAYLVAACRACNIKVGDPLKNPDPPHKPRTRW